MTITFFDFGESNTRALFNFLQDALAKNCEFEIRFGKFYQENNVNNSSNSTNRFKKYRFDSNMEIESFYNLKNMFNNQKLKKTVKKTREFIYQIDNRVVKRILDLTTNSVVVMSKQTIKTYDIYDYDLRMSVAYEKTDVTIERVDEFSLIRTKDRTSYELPFGNLDFTIVEQKDSKSGELHIKYEVEMEITSLQYKDYIMNYIMVILQKRQDNYYVIPGNEKRKVFSEYKNLVNTNYFVGAQPETLHKEKISNLYKTEYAVTDKADGDRYFLFIDKTGVVYFLDNNLNKILKTDLYCTNYKQCIIDGELVKIKNKIWFLAFDLLIFNGMDLRGNMEYDLKRRIYELKGIEFTKSDFSVKTYYFGNVFSGSKKILDSISDKFYENDGLIFTPVNEAYPKTKKWNTLFKWKPCELNTIDFYAKKIASENGIGTWNLYIQAPTNNTETKRTEKVLFDIQKLCNQENTDIVTYQTSFSESLIDSTTEEPYKTNTVIEFRWEPYELKFVPLRTRWDKTVNPSKHGNFVKVACDIWNNINNPIDKEYLLKFYSNSNEKDQYFERMRRFHNKVKEYLYNKYCKNISNLLELCSGKGGDMHKWFYNNIKKVDGYDISSKNIEECQRRYDSCKRNVNCNFYKLDLLREDASEIIYNNNSEKYDTVCCHFGIHYFFDSEKSVNNITRILDSSLKQDGYFVLTFMDNNKLNELFGDKNIISYEENDQIIYLLEKKLNGNCIYGNNLKITLTGNNILGEGSDEWIIDFDNFKMVMEKNGYKCIETDLFSNLYNSDFLDIDLLDCEKKISFLNRYCVFQKTSFEEIPSILQVIDDRGITQFNFETIELHQKNVSVCKVNDLYNIVDIINCIEYNYYKNKIQNQSLDDNPNNVFSNIVNMFRDLKIQYTPVFISDPLNFDEYKDDVNCIYFTYYKHIIEKKTDEIEEIIEYNNWYVLLYNDELIFSKPKQESIINETNVNETNVNETNVNETNVNETNVNETNVNKEQVKNEYLRMKNDNKKVTIKILKELLQKLGLKVSGKREELQERLENYF
jgi:SAM-dependent methyltransferase